MNKKLISWFANIYTKMLIPTVKVTEHDRRWSKSEDNEKMFEYSGAMANYVANTADGCRSELKKYLDAYMEEKKQAFTGLAYLEQLEKNYVYLERCVGAMVDHANLFLLGHEKAPKANDVDSVIDAIRLTTQAETVAHINYLKLGCTGCKYHENHAQYFQLRKIRLKDTRAYLDEIEFGCHFFQAKSTLSQVCLVGLWQEPNGAFAGIFDWDKNKMDLILNGYLKNATSSILNNLGFRDEKGQLLKILTL